MQADAFDSEELNIPRNLALISEVAGGPQDFEWFPTTTEIIQTIKNDMDSVENFCRDREPSVLDCGAGDGRVLMALTKGKKYAIEKSEPLLNALDRSIYVVGCDFHANTLIDKRVDVLTCNPPYREYIQWSTKIIREANAGLIYLVIPQRWKDSLERKGALKAREAQAVVIG